MELTIEDKIEINKLIRKYDGENSFVLSLQKQLKTNKYLERVEYNNKSIKIFSDKQYDIVKDLVDYEN